MNIIVNEEGYDGLFLALVIGDAIDGLALAVDRLATKVEGVESVIGSFGFGDQVVTLHTGLDDLVESFRDIAAKMPHK